MNNARILREIEDLLQSGASTKLEKARILDWMRADDPKCLGAVYVLLNKQAFLDKIEPKFSFDEVYKWSLHFLKRVLLENLENEWVSGRYEAARNLVALFQWLPGMNANWESAAAEIKKLLEEAYISGDERARICIITGVLEHLFDDSRATKLFSNWKQDSVLRGAYEEAISYAGEITERGREREGSGGNGP